MVQHRDCSSKEPFFSLFTYHRMQRLVEKLPVVIIVLNADQQVAYINEWGEKIYQTNLEAIQGRPLMSVLFVSEPAIVTNALTTVYQGKVVYNLRWNEEQYYEGRVFWREATFTPFFGATGTVEHVVVTINDITEHVRAQKVLLKSQEQYRMIFECSPDPILILERYFIRGANPAWEKLSGFKQEEVLGRHIEQMSPKVQASGKKSREEIEATITTALSGPAQAFRWRWLKKSGEEIDTYVHLGSMTNPRSPELSALVQLIIRYI